MKKLYSTVLVSLLLTMGSLHVCADEWEPFAQRLKTNQEWQAFRLNQVRLTPGSLFHQAMVHHSEYVLSLDAERLLYPVFKSVGLTPRGEHYGGWEPGVTYGHYLSSLSLYYAATGDKVYLDRLCYMLGEMRRAQKESGQENLCPWLTDALKEMNRGVMLLGRKNSDEACQPWDFNGAGNAWYGVHKILAGLRDAILYAKQDLALEIATPLLDTISYYMNDSNHDVEQAMLSVEQGGICETMADFYALTGKQAYMEAALRFTHKNVIYPTAEGEDVLYARHANDQIPKFVGAAREYELTGRDVFCRAAQNFWDIVTKHHTMANGGNGCFERFGLPDQESKRLDSTPAETCNTYNMLKLTHHLFMLSGKACYMDYCEWALYNHILASLDPCHLGAVTYYTALLPGATREYSTPHDSFWCCVGTGLENHALYGRDIFFHNGKDVTLSLFIPATLNWDEKGLQMEVETNLPLSDTVRLHIRKKGTFDGRIRIRRPHWAKDARMKGAKKEGDWLITPKVHEGQTLTLILPRKLHIRWSNDDSHYGSLCYGPLLLAGDLGTEGLVNGQGDSRGTPPMENLPILAGALNNLEEWIEADKSTEKLRFRVKEDCIHFPFQNGKMGQLMPYYDAHHLRYTSYWKLYQPNEYEECCRALTDRVIVGYGTSEEDHNLTGEKHHLAVHEYFWAHDKLMRWAEEGGEFSYRMAIDGKCTRPTTLICTFWGDEKDGHRTEILIDGKHLAEIDLYHHTLYSYIDCMYTIPLEWTKGKDSIIVTLRAPQGCTAGGLYQMRVTTDTQYK